MIGLQTAGTADPQGNLMVILEILFQQLRESIIAVVRPLNSLPIE
jgi:hypothetical protein